MHIQFFKPESALLEDYIEGYYFLAHDAAEPATAYLTFPNNFSILSVCEQVSIHYDALNVRVSGSPDGNFASELICHFRTPAAITYEGQINEITFYFKPLGLNAFLSRPLSAYTSAYFSAFDPYEDFRPGMQAILKEKDQDKRRELIEAYWIKKFLGFSHPVLQDITKDLLQKEKREQLEQIAQKYRTSRQYIHEQFKLHLCKTPAEFRKTQRFREALISSIEMKRRGDNLTALSYDALFYDQSHLIRDFKSFTGMTPKKFLEAISFQEGAMINWLYL